MQQNLTTSSMEALQVRGKAVRLVWDRGTTARSRRPAVRSRGRWTSEEGHDEARPMRLLAVVGVLALVAAACGSDEQRAEPSDRRRAAPRSDGVGAIGDRGGRAEPDRVAGLHREGYDWVKPFEDQTGCKVTVKYAQHLGRDGDADAAGRRHRVRRRVRSGDATNRLIAGGDVAAIDSRSSSPTTRT